MTMRKIVGLKTGKPRQVTLTEYLEVLDAIEKCIDLIRWRNVETTLSLLKELRFYACFNEQMRNDSIEGLEFILEEVYVAANAHSAP